MRTPHALTRTTAGAAATLGLLAIRYRRHFVRVQRRANTLRVPLDQDRGWGDGTGPVLHLVVLGDSCVEGNGLERVEETLSAQLALLLGTRTGRPVAVRALGASGSRLQRVLDEQVPRLPDAPCDVVVVSAGVNDAFKRSTPAQVESVTMRLLGAVRVLAPGAAVVLLPCVDVRHAPAVPRRAGVLVGQWFGRVGRAQARAARALGVPAATFARAPLVACYGRDGFHPGPHGTAVAAARVLEVLGQRWPGLLTARPSPASALPADQHDLVEQLA